MRHEIEINEFSPVVREFASYKTVIQGCSQRTVEQYLIDLRVQKALRLLKETDLPLSEIEGRCGFRDHAYFVKQFQKITDSSPEDYRAKKK